ncbi:hypothetical protein F5Y07DRAFT_86628 [Xylaria sp. FL0933]|nr:hypothetical protein F5Y07DRAFT_86628 [Xylaria sp. FL0933]
MPPHLHPRSRMTSSLFATTVAASFLVVGLPHLLPCPAPRVAYADASSSSSPSQDGSSRRRTRRRCQQPTEVKDGIAQFEAVGNSNSNSNNESESTCEDISKSSTTTITSTAPRPKRECPVPKPGGVIGQLIGLKEKKEKELENVNTARAMAKEDVERLPQNNDNR